jgi:hypothetical protein
MSSQYYSVTARVGVPQRHEVEVTIPLVGPAGPAGEGGAGAVESVNGQTGVVVLAAVDVGAVATSVLTTQGDIVVRGASAPQRLALGTGAGKPLVVGASGPEWSVADSNYVLSQSVKVFNAGSDEVDGVYLPTDSINGKVAYRKDDYTISWDGTAWIISGNTTDYYTSSDNTAFPWQATTWSVDSGDSPYPDVEQAAFSDLEAVLGTKSYNTRTPTSHTHGNITNAGLVGTTSGLPLKTGTGGIVEAGAFGAAAGQFAEGNHTHALSAITDAGTAAAQDADQDLGTTDDVTYRSVTVVGDPIEGFGGSFDKGLFSGSALELSPYTTSGPLDEPPYIELSNLGGGVTKIVGSASPSSTRLVQTPDASGTLALTSDFAAPPAIGNTTPAAISGTTGTFTTLSSNTGTITASTPLTVTQTWNNSATEFRAIETNITNTNSFTGSLHLACNVGGSTVAYIRRDGRIVAGANVYGGIGLESALLPQGVAVGNASYIGFCSNSFANDGAGDLRLFRDAANTLAQRNGTNAQEFRIYNTFTSSTNYQRLTIKTKAVTLSGLTGASVATTTGFIPDGAVLVGLTTRVSTAITGATGYDIGDGSDADRWGANVAIALNTSSDNTNWTAGTIECFTAAQEVTLTAVGSNFTGGAVVIVAHYLAGEAD